jgi:hypothetical protein
VASARSGNELRSASSLVRLLTIIAIVGVLVGVAGLVIPQLDEGGGGDAERGKVAQRASDFAVTYNTYSVTAKDDYQRRMKGLLTPAYYKEFTTVTNAVFAAIKSKDQKSGDAKVLKVAVDSIDDDSAVALVAVDAKITTNSDEAAVQRRFRWKVTFTRQKGQWLVSQFETVAPLDATAGEPSGTPTPTATPEPAPTPTEGSGQ